MMIEQRRREVFVQKKPKKVFLSFSFTCPRVWGLGTGVSGNRRFQDSYSHEVLPSKTKQC